MAASTPITINFQAKDWETIVGIISQTADSDLLDIIFKLMTAYKAAVPATANTLVPILTSEGALVKISTYFYGNTVMNVTVDSGASYFGRIMGVIRAANNTADNYISTTLATNDVSYAATALAIKKSGRKTLMILQYDNN